jgi:hypothetical protein
VALSHCLRCLAPGQMAHGRCTAAASAFHLSTRFWYHFTSLTWKTRQRYLQFNWNRIAFGAVSDLCQCMPTQRSRSALASARPYFHRARCHRTLSASQQPNQSIYRNYGQIECGRSPPATCRSSFSINRTVERRYTMLQACRARSGPDINCCLMRT